MLALTLLTVFVSLCHAFVPAKTWQNANIERAIDLQRAYIAERWSIEVKNIDSIPNSEYYLAIPHQLWDRLSVFSVYSENSQSVLPTELLEEATTSDNGNTLVNYIKVTLPPVAPKSTYKITVTLSITDIIEPLPRELKMTDEQTLLLQTTKTAVSAYDTKSYSLKLINVVEATEIDQIHGQAIEDEGSVKNNALTYEFQDVAPFTLKPLHLIYKHNLPLPRINNLQRGIWVSHWGATVQFVEDYQLTNQAAKLDSGFARAEFMKNKNTRQSHALLALQLQLEPEAEDIFFTDLVGNVSTSKPLGQSLYIKPRFPVFGGWHYNFTVGWTTPLSNYLKDLGDGEYTISVPFLNGPPDVAYDHVDLSIYLPEGSEVLDVACPIGYETISEDYELSYFDLGNGHTKVTISFDNMVDQVGKFEILIKYKYGFKEWMTKPLNIAKYVFVALISYLALSKIDIALKAKK
ncbi:Dolichyl-diphosphooligosaccharide--protein glycosyltransferase subunit 1 [Cyberlindnera fabianii]|uniref:Dolichyl-diphosphooligosaccharide--protein glycosyltransferase subunit 1 n=1 Tax=Cyberlindnera fabianii TaxID=36022 RepID=A0A1V2L457_CYBFA|nr:Dolichyl-diphosphooligosaccharide--protein glycosyltransferase subunit 1 [Cyberlindnera fabianii]